MKSVVYVFVLACLLSVVSSECPAGQVEITIVRTTTSWASEESFKIYQGEGTSGTLVYTQQTISNSQTYTWTTCLQRTLHTIHMTDGYGDGWSSGSKVVISAEGVTIGTFNIPYQGGNTHKELDAYFSFPNVIPSSQMWQYSNTAQTGTSWTSSTCTWETPTSYPAVSTITRYFRYTYTPTADLGYGMRVTVTTKYGFRMYLNGQVMFDSNVPSGDLSSTTEATSVDETAVARVYSTIMGLFPAPVGGKYEFAIELHGTSATTSGDESFSVIISFIDSTSVINDTAATITTHPDTGYSAGEAPPKLFDGSTGTKWCVAVSAASFPTYVTYRLPNNRRELMTKYRIASANDYSARDCKEWKVYGTNDFEGGVWSLLDHQQDIVFSNRLQYKSFDITNYISYNAFKWECLEVINVSNGNMQLSEIEYNFAFIEYVVPGISYPESSYTWYSHVDVVNISTGKSGYSNWQITGADGATLPAGLTFNTNTGEITGTPTATLAQTVFTVSAVYGVDSQTYTCTITITVNGCNLPTSIAIIATKTNYATQAETWTLKNASDEAVLSSTSSAASIGACLPVGEYTLSLASSSGVAWSGTSTLTIAASIGDHSFTIAKTRLATEGTTTIPLSLQFPLGPAGISTIKYLNDGTVPDNWYTTSFSDSAWTTLDASNRPSTTQKIKLYRSTFNVSSKTDYHGFELSFFSRAGVLIYLNGNEIYRRYLSSGAISSSSSATGGGTSTTWKSVTGSMNSINQGSNTIAVAIITLGEDSMPLDFDMYLRLLKDSADNTRYWGFTTSGTTAGNLFDMDPSTQMSVSTSVSEQKFVITFNDNRAELFNKYCFVTNSNNANYDPSEWTISGSNDGTTFTPIKNVTDVTFDQRSFTYCFYMATNTIAYSSYELTITKARVDGASNYALTAWNLYLQDLNALVVPELSFTPNTLTGYTSAAFPSAVCISSYYSTFSITPDLPAGLSINRNTGVITGISPVPVASTVYTISAMNHLDEIKTTTITLEVATCSGDKVSFTLEFNMASNGASCSFELIDQSNQQTVASRSSFTANNILSIPMCEHATTYKIKLSKSDTAGWGSSKVLVKLADGTPLLSESLAAGVTNKEYPFNPAYSVLPQWTEWNYLIDGSAAPAGWNTVDGAPASWTTGMAYQLPAATGVTQYYYKKFDIATLASFSAIDIAVTVKAGAIVYLNGHEIRRINMPEGDITASTAATTQFDSASLIITGEWINNNKLVEGTNILAIELHRYEENEVTNTFDASAILILDNMYMIIDGEGSSEPHVDGFEGTDKVFDNNASTKILTYGCAGIKFYWEYNNERREPIANYGLVNGNDCNVRSPSGWKLYGSNDGENWRPLQEKSGQFFTTYHDQIRHDFYNSHAFNKYMLEITECNNPALGGIDGSATCGTGRVQFADWYLFSKYLAPDAYCPATEDGFDPALNGDNSYIDCPSLYEGMKIRTCVDGTFTDVIDQCMPLPPAGISYPSSELSIYQNKVMDPVTPQVVAAEYKVTVFPALPAGLSLDEKTGTISGTPTTLQESKKYTFYVTNEAGRSEFVLYIAVVEAPINWLLIGIIIAVVVIIIIVVVVVIVVASKKKKSSAKKPTMKSTKKGTPAPKAVAKPKTAVKV